MTNISVSTKAIEGFEKATKDLICELVDQLNLSQSAHIMVKVSSSSVSEFKIDVLLDDAMEEVKTILTSGWCWSLKVAILSLNEQI